MVQQKKVPPRKKYGPPTAKPVAKQAPVVERVPFKKLLGQWLLQPAGALPSRIRWSTALLIFALGFILYSNTIFHDYALDDDLVYKLNSSVKKGIDGIPEIWRTTNMYGFNKQNFGAYRPFTQTLFALQYEMFGTSPHTQHFISILLYALTSALLFLLLMRLFRDKALWIPLAIGVLFAVHPIHTEVVANIKSSDEMISFLLGCVLTFLFLFKYIDTKRIVWLIASVVTFLLGLLSKEHILTLLPMIPLSLYFFTNEKLIKIALTSVWYLLPAALFLTLRGVLVESADDKIVFLDNFIWHIPTFTDKAGTIMYVLLQYLRLSFFPFPLSCDYSWAQTPQVSIFSVWPIISTVIYLALGVLAVLLFIKKNLLSWCILFFLFAISIYSHVYAGLAATMAERFLFTPSLPLIIAVILVFSYLTGKIKAEKLRYAIILWPMLMIALVFSIKTMSRNTAWKNSDTLFMTDIKNSPNSARINKSAGDVYINTGKEEKDPVKKREQMQQALVYLQRAYKIYADYPDNLLDLGTAWYYLGEYDSAMFYWNRHAQLQPWSSRVKQNVEYIRSGWFVKGQELGNQGRVPEAIEAFRRSLSYDSLFHPSWFNLGLMYASAKDYPLSETCMLKAISLDSTNADYWYNYGGLLFTLNDREGAKKAWARTLALKPDHPDAIKGLEALGAKK